MKKDHQISDVSLPVAETADLMVKAAQHGVEFSEFLGFHVLRSAYGVLHPQVSAHQNRDKAGVCGTETRECPEDVQ